MIGKVSWILAVTVSIGGFALMATGMPIFGVIVTSWNDAGGIVFWAALALTIVATLAFAGWDE